VTAREKLHEGINELGLAVNEQQENALFQYLQLLEKWNKRFNLTAVRDLNEMVSLHLLDSLSIVPFIKAGRLLDVGTGAGLPGIPLAICFPDIQFTLLDSNGKKIRFCRQAIMELGLKNIQAVQARIESYDGEEFDQITTRAFTGLDNMVGWLQHLISNKTQLLAMKGTLPEEEIRQLINSGFLVETFKLQVPFITAERHLVKIMEN